MCWSLKSHAKRIYLGGPSKPTLARAGSLTPGVVKGLREVPHLALNSSTFSSRSLFSRIQLNPERGKAKCRRRYEWPALSSLHKREGGRCERARASTLWPPSGWHPAPPVRHGSTCWIKDECRPSSVPLLSSRCFCPSSIAAEITLSTRSPPLEARVGLIDLDTIPILHRENVSSKLSAGLELRAARGRRRASDIPES